MDYRSICKQHDNEFDEPDHGNDGEKKQMIIKKIPDHSVLLVGAQLLKMRYKEEYCTKTKKIKYRYWQITESHHCEVPLFHSCLRKQVEEQA